MNCKTNNFNKNSVAYLIYYINTCQSCNIILIVYYMLDYFFYEIIFLWNNFSPQLKKRDHYYQVPWSYKSTLFFSREARLTDDEFRSAGRTERQTIVFRGVLKKPLISPRLIWWTSAQQHDDQMDLSSRVLISRSLRHLLFLLLFSFNRLWWLENYRTANANLTCWRNWWLRIEIC